MLQNLRPLGDRVLVELFEAEEKTASGLIIPDAAKEKTQQGTIVAVGKGRKDNNGNTIPLEVNVGDTIFFGKYAGTQADENHLIIREEEILGVVVSK